MRENRLSTRIVALLLVALAVGYGLWARQFEMTAMTDPLGPRAFPYMLAILMAVISIYLVIYPDAEGGSWPKPAVWGRIVLALVVLVAYAYLLVPLGFIVATSLVVAALALLFRGPLVWSGITAVVFSILTYALFVYGLGLSLPTGWMFR